MIFYAKKHRRIIIWRQRNGKREIAKEQTLKALIMGTYLRGLTIAQAEQRAQKNPGVRKLMDEQKAQVASMKFKVVNVRIDDIDDKIKKSTNSADLIIVQTGQTRKIPITFTDQLNDDGGNLRRSVIWITKPNNGRAHAARALPLFFMRNILESERDFYLSPNLIISLNGESKKRLQHQKNYSQPDDTD